MIILDFETTELKGPAGLDLNKQPRITEVGIVVMEGSEVEIEYGTLINPGIPIPADAQKITGIDDSMVKDAPSFPRVYTKLVDLFIGQRMVVAHNLSFDLGVLVIELRRIGREFAFPYPPVQFCTAEQTTHLFGGKFSSQSNLYQHLFNEDPQQTHRALDDAKQLARIVQELHGMGIIE